MENCFFLEFWCMNQEITILHFRKHYQEFCLYPVRKIIWRETLKWIAEKKQTSLFTLV